MTLEQLIAEGRKLQRPCVFLRQEGAGPVAARWHEPSWDVIDETLERPWITVDASQIPGLSPAVRGFLTVITDEETHRNGRVEVTPDWPERGGTPLYAHAAQVLPSPDAVFACGSEAVGDWLASHGWKREWRFNSNFKDRDLVLEYERRWLEEFPLYWESDVYAVLGGWHCPGPDHDWHDLIDEHLMVLTIRGSEPWVEAWHTRAGEFRVIERIT
jgi:hypothetical protein